MNRLYSEQWPTHLSTYWLRLTRNILTFTALVALISSGLTYRRRHIGPATKRRSVTGNVSFNWSQFLKCSVYKKPKVKTMHSSNGWNTTENNSINSQAQDTNSILPNVFLTGIYLSPFINMSSPCSSSAKVRMVLVSRQQYFAFISHIMVFWSVRCELLMTAEFILTLKMKTSKLGLSFKKASELVFKVHDDFSRQQDNGRSLHDVAKCKERTAEVCRVALPSLLLAKRNWAIIEDHRKCKVLIAV
jgi:hypothetical protein